MEKDLQRIATSLQPNMLSLLWCVQSSLKGSLKELGNALYATYQHLKEPLTLQTKYKFAEAPWGVKKKIKNCITCFPYITLDSHNFFSKLMSKPLSVFVYPTKKGGGENTITRRYIFLNYNFFKI